MRAAVVVFVACALVCLLAHLAIVVSVVRTRGSRTDAVPRPRQIVEIVWALVPVVALAFVLTATWTRVREHATKPGVVMKVAQ